jgi:hypothetical protein
MIKCAIKVRFFKEKKGYFLYYLKLAFFYFITKYLVTLWLTDCTALKAAPSTVVQGAKTIRQAARVGVL